MTLQQFENLSLDKNPPVALTRILKVLVFEFTGDEDDNYDNINFRKRLNAIQLATDVSPWLSLLFSICREDFKNLDPGKNLLASEAHVKHAIPVDAVIFEITDEIGDYVYRLKLEIHTIAIVVAEKLKTQHGLSRSSKKAATKILVPYRTKEPFDKCSVI